MFASLQSNWLQTFAEKAQEALAALQPSQEPQQSTEQPVRDERWGLSVAMTRKLGDEGSEVCVCCCVCCCVCVCVCVAQQELLEKLKESEESRGTLQAECDQYRSVLAETVSAPASTTHPYAPARSGGKECTLCVCVCPVCERGMVRV